jgi:hypothetical protein
LERWVKRPEAKPPAEPSETEPKQQGRVKRFARGVLNVVRPKPERIEPKTQTPELQTEAQQTVQETRTFGRRVLRFVMGVAERPAPEPQTAEPLRHAADDLRGALHELDEVAPERPKVLPEPELEPPQPAEPETAYTGGDGDGLRTPEAPAAEPIKPHIIEVQRRLETSKEKLTHALAVAGMGVIGVGAVLAIGRHYLKAKHRRQATTERQQLQQKVIARQQEQLAEQRQALQLLQRPQPERPQPEYYKEVSDLAHRQADITREVAHEVQQTHVAAPELPPPRTETVPTPPPVEQFHIPEQSSPAPNYLKPLVRVERGDSIERPQTSRDQTAMHAGGGAVVAGLTTPQKQAPTEPPQTTNDVRQIIIQKAKPKPHLWLYGVVLIAALVVAAIIVTLVIHM